MAKYHKYVFDERQRKFIGKFEEMYKAEAKEKFDSWHQEESRQLQREIDLLLYERGNFDCVVDLGCGKGAFTHRLKKINNRVIGVDISETAIATARERYHDIQFICLDINNITAINSLYKKLTKNGKKISLTISSELFSYLINWENLLIPISKFSEYFLISLFIPENPIGFVKSYEMLLNEINKYFKIEHDIYLMREKFVIVMGKSLLK